MSKANPFEENGEDLVTLDDHVCESATAAIYVLNLESLGQEQYNTFRKSLLESGDTLLTAPIKRINNLLLFHEKKMKRRTAIKVKLQHFKDHAELYGHAGFCCIRRVLVWGIWRNFFVTHLLHTHLHCHPQDASTRLQSQICYHISWKSVRVAPFLSTTS